MNGEAAKNSFFTQSLMQWHERDNDRDLPWKSEKDPYKIWLSEIILQQTRALQGLPYYLKFTEAFPTVKDMAACADEQAFRLWQGLGYYNRCKNMLATARFITDELEGRFPDAYENILQLKGIGPYTAAAIASFAFGLPHAVVDGNVYRVLARYFGIETAFDTTEGKKRFAQKAQDLLDTSDSAGYNQAIMDLGATVCTPQTPKCVDCPLQKNCTAYHENTVALLPVKSKKTSVGTRFFHYLLLQTDDQIWIRKRTGKDIWQNLHEPFLLEHAEALNTSSLQTLIKEKGLQFSDGNIVYEGSLKQRLTHLVVETRFFGIKMKAPIKLPDNDGRWVSVKELKNIAFPKTLVSFFEKKLYF